MTAVHVFVALMIGYGVAGITWAVGDLIGWVVYRCYGIDRVTAGNTQQEVDEDVHL